MPSSARHSDWDIFCTVIDNFGDIGVCWRLARQLGEEHGFKVRLWVDELASFQKICPEIDPQLAVQSACGVEVRYWDADIPDAVPGDVVIEAFACHLPTRFIAAMAERNPSPVWINLEYLSAEAWVSGCHALPSPHPRLPLTKHFFFPGFDETTGGLLRERGLDDRRQAFCTSEDMQADFWRKLGQSPPSTDALLVSLFAYENPAIADLLTVWAHGRVPVCCLAPVTRTLPAIAAFAGQPLQGGDIIHRGSLEIRMLPFVAQPDYDRLLWSCDINFVRGEDSFVRAQWAARPLVWHIYPQKEDAHLIKLGAFLDLYCADLPESVAEAVRRLFMAWNGEKDARQITPDLWTQWMKALPDLRQHATNWLKTRSKQEDLCSALVRFSRSKL
ncbi:elongation factor P maturation arginine rhamnosyltransferase EarP [Propionivibrio sp.]|uniref:elongation factor P maturation arginine rhamnosyltransferase EarP n=1 Tax=Propionivibrio sp. TaxID=2212460 RepID=UPI003BF03F92